MNPIFKATHIGHKINIAFREKFNDFVRTLPEDIEVIVRPYRATRSNEQNRYYFGVIIKLICEHTGHFTMDIHEILKARSDTCRKFITVKGEEFQTVRSTTELNTKEMEEYLTECRMWASQKLELFIPLPNEVDY